MKFKKKIENKIYDILAHKEHVFFGQYENWSIKRKKKWRNLVVKHNYLYEILAALV